MAGTYPATPYFQAVNFKVNTPTLKTETLSGKTRRVGMGHSYYTFSVKYNNLTRYDAGPILGFLSQQYGSLESFQIVLPDMSYSKQSGQTAHTVTTAAGASRGDDSVTVSGPTTGENLLRAGDFFKFSNHSKVYMCAVTWTTGNPLYFSGSLVADVPLGTQLTITAVPFTVTLANDVQEYETGIGGITNMSLDMREVW